MALDIYPTGTFLALKKTTLIGPVKCGNENVMVGFEAYPIWEVGYENTDPKLKTLIPVLGRTKTGGFVRLGLGEANFYVEELVADLPKLFTKLNPVEAKKLGW
jgi:hypothetical protein